MTRSDFIIKWGVYTLALVPVWILELYVLSRYPLFGVKPMLLPLAVVAVAVLEGSTAGGGFGLFVGVLCDACYHDTFGGMTLGLCLVGVIIGEFLAAQRGLGYLIIYGSQVFQLDMVLMSIVILCVMAMILYQGINLVEKHCLKRF